MESVSWPANERSPAPITDGTTTPAGPDDAPAALPLPAVMMPELPPATGPAWPPAVTVLPDDNAPPTVTVLLPATTVLLPAVTVPLPAALLSDAVVSPAVTVVLLLCASAAGAAATVSAASPAVSFPAPIVSPGADVSPAGSVPFVTGPSA